MIVLVIVLILLTAINVYITWQLWGRFDRYEEHVTEQGVIIDHLSERLERVTVNRPLRVP